MIFGEKRKRMRMGEEEEEIFKCALSHCFVAKL
jgi:hypothetical protein